MKKMSERKCLRCNSIIFENDIKEENAEFWICPKCNKKTYKYTSWGYLAAGEHSKKFMIRKESRDLRGNISIIQKEKNNWTHEVIDDEGNAVHKKHKK